MDNFISIENSSTKVQKYLQSNGEVDSNIEARERFKKIEPIVLKYLYIDEINPLTNTKYTADTFDNWTKNHFYSFASDSTENLYLAIEDFKNTISNDKTGIIKTYSCKTSIIDIEINDNDIKVYDILGKAIDDYLSSAHTGIFRIKCNTEDGDKNNIILYQGVIYQNKQNIIYQYYFSSSGSIKYRNITNLNSIPEWNILDLQITSIANSEKIFTPFSAAGAKRMEESFLNSIQLIEKEIFSLQQEKVGQKTESNGEIFNDYENNIADAEYAHVEGFQNSTNIINAHVEGVGNSAVLKSFVVDSVEGYNIYLKNVSSDIMSTIKPNMHIYYEKINPTDGKAYKYRGTIEEVKSNYIIIKQDTDSVNIITAGVIEPNIEILINGGSIGTQEYKYPGISTTHIEGQANKGTLNAHVEGANNEGLGVFSHVEGRYNIVTGEYAHGEGYNTQAIGLASHVEGINNIASGKHSHVEGEKCKAYGIDSHAEGFNSNAIGNYSHVEGGGGTGNFGYGSYSHVEGCNNIAAPDDKTAGTNSFAAHVEGRDNKANANYTHVEGQGNIANIQYQHVQGCYANTDDKSKNFIHVVGNGSASKKSNAHTLTKKGAAWYAESVEAPTIYTNQVVLLSSGNKKFALKVKDDGTLYTEEVKE